MLIWLCYLMFNPLVVSDMIYLSKALVSFNSLHLQLPGGGFLQRRERFRVKVGVKHETGSIPSYVKFGIKKVFLHVK